MITVNLTGRDPIYEQICKSICAEIARGTLKENDKLPGTRTLAKELGLNPNTVAKSYAKLEHDGIIYSAPGKGCFVAKQNGGVQNAFTKDFEEKVREALITGISADVLVEIVNKLNNERQAEAKENEVRRGSESIL